MTVTLTGNLPSALAAWSPPNPPPTIRTRGWRPSGVLFSASVSWLNFASLSLKRCRRGHNGLAWISNLHTLARSKPDADGTTVLPWNHADGTLTRRSAPPRRDV